jgi:hypothetical protein
MKAPSTGVYRMINPEVALSLATGNSAFSILFLLFEFSCAAQLSNKPYYEDLSGNRPKFVNAEDSTRKIPVKAPVQDPVLATVKPTKNVNAKVDVILDSIDRFNRTRKYLDGFTIQIYSGQNREDAMNAKQKMSNGAPDLTANLQYIQPKFRVTVGNYYTKLEAQKDLVRLKRIFSNAILVPERILIK